MTRDDIETLLPSWIRHLRAERKSEQTVKIYGDGIRSFLRWLASTGLEPALDRRTVDAFTAGLMADGAEPSTARSRQLSVRRFSAWLADEGEIERDQLLGIRPPKLDDKAVPVLDDDQLRDLLAACKGPDLRDKRDEAIVRLMIETVHARVRS